MRQHPDQHSHKRRQAMWMRFTVSISLVVALFILAVFVGLFIRNSELINQQLLTRARAHFHTLTVTRAWNAIHGGVYVEKLDGVESNPWLEDPDIRTRDGRVFTLRNPAIMTRELSEFSPSPALVSFRITSPDPVNPDNLPDEFEQDAFQAFEDGEREFYGEQATDEGRHIYRYVAPLATEESCLTCHAKQGYRLGEIRGGISVNFDITDIKKALSNDARLIFILCTATLIALLGIIYLFITRLMRSLDAAHKRILELASTDELTGLENRRAIFERMEHELRRARRYARPVSCILLDLDHFKEVNDTLGHEAGDRVLSQLAEVLGQTNRASDHLARYGGEEMLVLLPETGLEGAVAVAEKMRQAVAEHVFEVGFGRTVQITASLGVASVGPDRVADLEGPEDLFKLADKALYESKDAGRNSVRINRDLA